MTRKKCIKCNSTHVHSLENPVVEEIYRFMRRHPFREISSTEINESIQQPRTYYLHAPLTVMCCMGLLRKIRRPGEMPNYYELI